MVLAHTATLPYGSYEVINGNQQSFVLVPEPTTLVAGALLILPFGAGTLRVLAPEPCELSLLIREAFTSVPVPRPVP